MDEWMNGSHSYKLWGLGRPRRQRLALPPTPQKQTIMPTVTSYLSIRTAVFLKSFRFWLKTTNLFLFDGLSSLQTAPLHLVISVGWEIFFGGSWFMRMSTNTKTKPNEWFQWESNSWSPADYHPDGWVDPSTVTRQALCQLSHRTCIAPARRFIMPNERYAEIQLIGHQTFKLMSKPFQGQTSPRMWNSRSLLL